MKKPDEEMYCSHLQFSRLEQYGIIKTAVEHMNIQVFVYDCTSRKLYFFTRPECTVFDVIRKSQCTVEEILENNMIDPEYASVFRELFDSIHQGDTASAGRILFRGVNGKLWSQVSLFQCASGDSSGRAIGTIQIMGFRTEAELQYSQEKKYRQAMMADFQRIYEINVTKDRFIRLESIQDSTDYDSWDPYTRSMNRLRETKVYREDWDIFLEIASRENLLHGFQEGITEFYCEYRTVNENGQIAWSSSATHLLEDPISGDIKGFIYVKDIDEQKKRELELEQQAERDPLTGIYNRRTAEKLIKKLLPASSDEKMKYAFLTIDMDDFKYVNDKYGHMKGDYLLIQTALKISAVLSDKDIFARLGGDEFIIFLSINDDDERLERISTLIINMIRDISIDKDNPCFTSVSIGISIAPRHGTTFEDLYKTSDQALYRAKQRGKGCIEIYNKNTNKY